MEDVVNLYKKYINNTKYFLADIATGLGIDKKNASGFKTFVTDNGNELTIRISNHNADTDITTFDTTRKGSGDK